MPVRSGKVRSSSQPRRGAASSTERANKNTRIVARQPATASTEGPPKKRRKRGLSKKKGASASDGRSVGRVSKTAQPIQEKLHFDKDVVAALPKPWQKLLSTNTDASPSQTSQSSQVDLSALQNTVKTIGSMLNQMTQPVLLELVRRRIVSAGGTGVDSELKKYSQKRNSKKSPLKSVIVKKGIRDCLAPSSMTLEYLKDLGNRLTAALQSFKDSKDREKSLLTTSFKARFDRTFVDPELYFKSVLRLYEQSPCKQHVSADFVEVKDFCKTLAARFVSFVQACRSSMVDILEANGTSDSAVQKQHELLKVQVKYPVCKSMGAYAEEKDRNQSLWIRRAYHLVGPLLNEWLSMLATGGHLVRPEPAEVDAMEKEALEEVYYTAGWCVKKVEITAEKDECKMPKAVAQLIAYALSCLKWDRQRAEQRSLPMKKVNQLPAGKRVYISASGFTFFKIIEDACRGFLAHRVFSQVRQRYEDMVEEYCMASDSLMCAFSEVVNHRWGAARSYRTQYAPIPPEKQVVLRAAMQPFVKRYLASRVLRSYAMMSRSMDASRAGQQTTRGGLSRRTGDESEQTRP